MNQQEHDYMHAHGIEHTHQDQVDPRHSHEHAHTHDHSHSACEGHACDHNCGSCGSMDPRSEALALMQYMVKHNTAHAAELAKLGKRLHEIGENMAGDQVMLAVADFEKGNMRLSTVLAALNFPKA